MHGGVITGPGVPNVLIGGMPASVVGDMHVCPMATPATPPVPHVGGPVVSPGAPTVLIGGRPAATIGSMCTCVGPPDSVIMGAMTVILGAAGSGAGSAGSGGGGGAAGANASAAAASFDNFESVTKEKNWIEFEFVDSAGNPVSGVPYKFTDPDGKVSESVLRLDGKIRRDAVSEGQGEVVLMSVGAAKWSSSTAGPGDQIDMRATVEGFDPGIPAVFHIYRSDVAGPDVLVEEKEASVQGSSVEATWTLENGPRDEVIVPEEGAKEALDEPDHYTSPQYYFEILVGQCTARSGVLTWGGNIEVEVLDEEGAPLAGEEYILFLADGEVRKGTLDGGGTLSEEAAAGPHCLRFPNLPDLDVDL